MDRQEHNAKERHPRRRRRSAALARTGAIVFAIMLTTGLVMQRSMSAFTDDDTWGPNNIGAATVSIDADTRDAAPFNWVNVIPGKTEMRCVQVDYTGTTDELKNVKMFGDFTTKTAGQYVNTTIAIAPAGAGCDADADTYSGPTPAQIFSGTLDTYLGLTNYVNGQDTGWKPVIATDKSRAFIITLTMPSDVDNAAQGKQAHWNFVWEVQSA